MQNKVLNNIPNVTDFLRQVAEIFWFTFPVVIAIWYFFYVLGVRKQIKEKEKEIFNIKKEIDDMMEAVNQKRRGYINQSQLEAITENNRILLRAKLETLKMGRQFLLDKISILNLIRK